MKWNTHLGLAERGRSPQCSPHTRDIMNLIIIGPRPQHSATSHLPEGTKQDSYVVAVSVGMELRESPTYYPSDARLSKMSRLVPEVFLRFLGLLFNRQAATSVRS